MIEATITRKKGDTYTLCAESWEQLLSMLGAWDFIAIKARTVRDRKKGGKP